MKARVARSIERLNNIATELSLTLRTPSGEPRGSTRIGLELGSPPPMYEYYVREFRKSVTRVLHLAHQESLLTPQEAGEGEKTDGLRDRLRVEYMIPLRRTAKPLLRFAPGVEKALKVPHKRAAHRKIVASAEAMLKAVRPYRKILISAGFSKTFLTELRDLTKELKRIATSSSRRQAAFSRVTDAIAEELATANEMLGAIDGLILARALRNRRLAKAWKALMKYPTHMGRPPARKQTLSAQAMLAAGGSPVTALSGDGRRAAATEETAGRILRADKGEPKTPSRKRRPKKRRRRGVANGCHPEESSASETTSDLLLRPSLRAQA